jgi:hypothetical protein
MSETHTPLYDEDGVEVGTLVLFGSGVQRIALDPQPYATLTGGYKIPPRPWPLFDAEKRQVTW